MAIRNCSQIWRSPIKKPEKQALKDSNVLNFRLNFKVVMVVLGEILPQWEAALVSGYQNLQSDIGVTYYETGETGSQSLLCTKLAYSQGATTGLFPPIY